MVKILQSAHFMRKLLSQAAGQLRRSEELVRKYVMQRETLILALVLLLGFTIVLLQPAVGSVRTVEIDPENTGVLLTIDAPLTYDITVPTSTISYFSVWVVEKHDGKTLELGDYSGVQLEVRDVAGHLVRTSLNPQLVKRRDEPVLRFKFAPLAVVEHENYTFTVRQTNAANVLAQLPIVDMVGAGESVDSAFELGEHRNWLTLLVEKVYGEDLVGKDISFYLFRGGQIASGINPYDCVTDPDEECFGYPTHLPGMYLITAGFVVAGVDDLNEWATAWRPLSFATWLAVGLVLFIYSYVRKQPALAVAALGFWLFNRWSLYVLKVAHTDFLGVLLMVLSIVSVGRWPMTAAVLLGTSLAVKQVGVLLVPLFLIAAWRVHSFRLPKIFLLIGLILLMPVATSIPFLVANPEAAIQGWLTAATRPAQTLYEGVPSFDQWLDITGPSKSMVMLALVLCAYVAAWRKSVGMVGGALLIMAIVIGFTHVLFHQYVVWFIPLIPLAIADMIDNRTSKNTLSDDENDIGEDSLFGE